jgi:RNA polymerase sigma-70 factor, ECF subfamily
VAGRDSEQLEQQEQSGRVSRAPQPGDGQVVDLQLVMAARSGSGSAFDLLVDRYTLPIQRYLYRLVGDRELAADLTQETFLDAYRALHRLPDDQSFAAWLYRAALNEALPVLRRRRLLRMVPLDAFVNRAGRWIGRAPGESERVDDVAEREVIQATLDQLSVGERAAVLLHSLGGFTTDEVARILEITPDAAGKRISRGKERFRQGYLASTIGDLDSEPGRGPV